MAAPTPKPKAKFTPTVIIAIIAVAVAFVWITGGFSGGPDELAAIANCQQAVENHVSPVAVNFGDNPTKVGDDNYTGQATTTVDGTDVTVTYFCSMDGEKVDSVDVS